MAMAPTLSTTHLPLMDPTQWLSSMLTRRCPAGEHQPWAIRAELWRDFPGATPSGPGLGQSPSYLSEPPSQDFPILLHSRVLCLNIISPQEL